jgi:hypothetical protein
MEHLGWSIYNGDMPVITPEVLNSYNLYYYSDFRTIQRGQQLFRQQRAVVSAFNGDSAICEVHGSRLAGTVEVRLIGKRQLEFACSCPDWEVNRPCEHVVAALMALNQYLVTEAHNHWEYKLSLALDSTPKKTAGSHRQRYAILFGLQKEKYVETSRFSLVGYVLKSADWPELERLGGQVPQKPSMICWKKTPTGIDGSRCPTRP